MAIKAGRLRHRVRLERYADLLDSNGDVLQDPVSGEISREWTLVATVWAAIEPLSAREFIQSQATQAEVVARITIRYRADLEPTWRIVHGSNVYAIHGVLPDVDSGLEYLTLPVSRGPSDGE